MLVLNLKLSENPERKKNLKIIQGTYILVHFVGSQKGLLRGFLRTVQKNNLLSDSPGL